MKKQDELDQQEKLDTEIELLIRGGLINPTEIAEAILQACDAVQESDFYLRAAAFVYIRRRAHGRLSELGLNKPRPAPQLPFRFPAVGPGG